MSENVNCDEMIAESTEATVIGEKCPAVGYQKVGICAPVTVTPFARKGIAKTKCCGEPVVVSGACCPGKRNGTCTFTVSQVICVEVPVDFGATVSIGDAYVDCFGASACNICSNCRGGEEDC